MLNREWLSETNLDNYIAIHEFYTSGPQSGTLETEKMGQKSDKWIGKIGLIYITDMVESSININCTSAFKNKSKINGDWACKNSNGNWLHKEEYSEWTISRDPSSRNYLWGINFYGSFSNTYTPYNSSFSVRPSFFLKPTTTLIGEGTKQNPFQVKTRGQ